MGRVKRREGRGGRKIGDRDLKNGKDEHATCRRTGVREGFVDNGAGVGQVK